MLRHELPNLTVFEYVPNDKVETKPGKRIALSFTKHNPKDPLLSLSDGFKLLKCSPDKESYNLKVKVLGQANIEFVPETLKGKKPVSRPVVEFIPGSVIASQEKDSTEIFMCLGYSEFYGPVGINAKTGELVRYTDFDKHYVYVGTASLFVGDK